MTLAELQTRLANYVLAESKILQSQEYSVGQGGGARKNRRADLDVVRSEIANLNRQIAAYGRSPASRILGGAHYIR